MDGNARDLSRFEVFLVSTETGIAYHWNGGCTIHSYECTDSDGGPGGEPPITIGPLMPTEAMPDGIRTVSTDKDRLSFDEAVAAISRIDRKNAEE